jgi:hypothetical protein
MQSSRGLRGSLSTDHLGLSLKTADPVEGGRLLGRGLGHRTATSAVGLEGCVRRGVHGEPAVPAGGVDRMVRLPWTRWVLGLGAPWGDS